MEMYVVKRRRRTIIGKEPESNVIVGVSDNLGADSASSLIRSSMLTNFIPTRHRAIRVGLLPEMARVEDAVAISVQRIARVTNEGCERDDLVVFANYLAAQQTLGTATNEDCH